MKKLILGILIGLTIGVSTNAFAAIGDIVEAKFSQFTFVVNGEEKQLEADPLTYQGTTYLPVRIVSNLLGYDVVYKADTRVIELNTPESTQTVTTETQTVQTVVEPAIEPTPTPEPTVTPTATPEPTPTPAPDNTAACQHIKDDYAYQIAMVSYSGGNNATKGNKILQLEYERDQALSAAGCN